MIIRKEKPLEAGYTTITTLDGPMLLDFGILKLNKGDCTTCSLDLERAWMLIKGKVRFSWLDAEAVGERASCIDEPPVVLHAPRQIPVMVERLRIVSWPSSGASMNKNSRSASMPRAR